MGVVYKLKQEVVDFIINEKKSNPALGCRNLVNLVEAKFQIKVSKSAINEVIKSAQLSSAIGRKPLAVKLSPKFKNPSPSPVVTPPESQRFVPSFSVPPQAESRDRRTGQNDRRTAVPQNLPSIWCDGAGCFFLKAAQWELCRRSFFREMIRKYVSADFLSEAQTLMEALLFFPLFGVRREEDILSYQNPGLWVIHGVPTNNHSEKILKLIKNIKDQKDFFLRLYAEIPPIFLQANFIKIILEDGTELALDAQMLNLGTSPQEVGAYYSAPVEKLVERLINEVITSTRPVVIKNLNTSSAGAALAAAFENIPGKRMVKAAILDEQGEEILKFTTIPLKQRFFILGIEKNFQLKETPGCRSVESKYDLKLSILTNISEGFRSSQDIISEYVKEFPDSPQDSHIDKDFYADTKAFFSPVDMFDLWANFEAILEGFNKYAQRHFFPQSYARMDIFELKNRFYQLAGYVKQDKKILEISLILPTGYAYRSDLEYAIQKLNEFHVQNPTGQTVFLKIVP